MLFTNQGSRLVGWSRGDEFEPVTNICSEDDQDWADENIDNDSDCRFTSGNDLIVWTKHFTKYVIYTESIKSAGREIMQCNDGVDNDNDGVKDMDDPGCIDINDNSETNSISVPAGKEPEAPALADEKEADTTEVVSFDVIMPGLKPGDLIKAAEYSSVYYLDIDGKRHSFMDKNSFRSYYTDFSNVKVVPVDVLRAFPLGEPRLYKENSLVKFSSLPKVYKVAVRNVLRWIMTESIFNQMGHSFNDVSNVSDAFWFLYQVGDDITEQNYQNK